MAYDPVADYLARTRKTPADLSLQERLLLGKLTQAEVTALISIERKGRGLPQPFAVGPKGY